MYRSFLARLFFKEKVEVMSSLWCRRWRRRRRCRRRRRRRRHRRDKPNIGYNFISVEANLTKLHMFVHHHKGYNLTKDNNSAFCQN